MAILHINEQEFEKEVLKSEKPVLLDFLQPGAALAKCWDRYWNSFRKSRQTIKL